MIPYLIEVALIHLSLYLIYLFFLRRETQYRLRRAFLIIMTLTALGLPFLDIPLLPSNGTISISNAIGNTLSPVIINASMSVKSDQFIYIPNIGVAFILWGVACLFLLYLLWSLRALFLTFRKSNKTSLYGVRVRLLLDETHSFSFFKWIFVGKDRDQSIILHEQGHAQYGHSMDVLILNLFRAAFWWLPSSWMILKEIRLIHEYQADAFALKHADAQHYKKLLIGNALSSVNFTLASSFHHGTLLKRLKAMQTKKKMISKWKIGVLGTLVATVVLVFSCSEQLEQDVQEISENASLVLDYPPEVQNLVVELSTATGASYSVMEIHGDLNNDKLSKLIEQQKFAKLIKTKDEGKRFLILSKDDAAYDVVAEISKSEDGVYDLVDDQPEYEGGIQKFYQYIGENLEYPEQARRLGVEGKVYVQFIINTDGTVSNVKAVKGIGAGCDAEAERVISGSDQWKPGKVGGKVVRTRMMVPILYNFDS